MELLDLHTHRTLPQYEGIYSASPAEYKRLCADFPEQYWSIGFHPWNIGSEGVSEPEMKALRELASSDKVVAIGECGIDLTHAGAAPMWRQLPAFKSQAELAATLGKPLIIHCVKAWDVIISVHKELAAKYNAAGREEPHRPLRWVIHGFRGKPSVAQILLKQGIGLSYGEHFNAESLLATPLDHLYAETDESQLDIRAVIERMHAADPRVTEELIAANLQKLIGGLQH